MGAENLSWVVWKSMREPAHHPRRDVFEALPSLVSGEASLSLSFLSTSLCTQPCVRPELILEGPGTTGLWVSTDAVGGRDRSLGSPGFR